VSDITLDWSFGGQLRRYRTEKQITLREMCRLLKFDSGNYSKMERGELPPPKDKDALKEILDPLELNEVQTTLIMTAAYNFHCGRLFQKFWQYKEKGSM
jgi:transcriptional regulator with XRE-family HTH domain